jgi:biopolymer transport protein ExbD
MLMFLLAQLAASEAPAEIVVTARRSKCLVALRGHDLSRAELDRHIRQWAQGIPVQVRAPDRASYRCLAKLLFRLSDHGVRAVEFVDPAQPEATDK